MAAGTRIVRERACEDEGKYAWIVWAMAMVVVGVLAGYVLTAVGKPAPSSAAVPAVAVTAPGPNGGTVVDEPALQAYRDILARDPKNLQAAVGAGNLLYDARRYAEAIPFYQQATALNPSDVDVRTDLGTALWYSGRPDDAVAQYQRSLAINPTHAQTLFNLGIVQANGRRDYAAAAAAWETLLASNPTYPNAASVRTMLADAQSKIGSAGH